MGKITSYPKVSELSNDDVLLVDGSAGTRTISAFDAAKDFSSKHSILPSIEFSTKFAWNGAVGSEVYSTTNTNRCGNPNLVTLPNKLYLIQVKDGYRISFRKVDDNNICTYDSGWITGQTTFVGDGVSKYAFTGGKRNDTNTTLDELYENVEVVESTDIQDVIISDVKSRLDARDSLCIIQLAGNAWVELDTSSRTLTLPADFSIVENSAPYTRYNFEEETVVAIPEGTNSVKVVFDKNTKTFSVLRYYDLVPNNTVIVAVCHLASAGAMSITCRYKINGKPYSITLPESSNISNVNNTLCAIAPSNAQPYIKFDTSENPKGVAVTFPNDCSFFSPAPNGTRYTTTKEHNVIVSNSGSTLQKIYFNPSDETFSAVGYNARIPSGCLFVAVVRTVPIAVTINAPYSVNGNLYGVFTVDKRAQISLYANIKAVNHRGYNIVAPENTLPAFKLSRQNGFKYVETDVRFTSDGVPVLLHDETINRTGRNADGSSIEDTIRIADITYEQSQEYDFGVWKSSEYAGTKIPTLSEFISLCRDIGLTPRVELNVLTVANAQTMFDVINNYGMSKKVEYNCNEVSVIEKFLELEPSATIVFGMGSYNADYVDAVGALKTATNTIIINMYYSNVSEELIQKCKKYGIELEVWTINSASIMFNLDPYISGVTSDNINASVEFYNRSIS